MQSFDTSHAFFFGLLKMNPLHLKTFLVVTKHLNYTRAAEELFLSQPAVSRQIQLLEKNVGVQLFEQIGRSLHLTDAGQALLAEATRLLGDIERIKESVRGHKTAEFGNLRIGASTTPGLYLVPKALGTFHRRHPGVKLSFIIENSTRIEQRIIGNEIDFGFVGARTSNESIRCEQFVQDEIVCFCAPEHPLAKLRSIPPTALEEHLWIMREPGSGTRRLFEKWLAENKVVLRHTMQIDCPEGIKALVAANVGLSFMSSHGLREEIKRGVLVKLAIRGLKLQREIFLVRHRQKMLSPAMSAFLNIAR
jgi:DNA-binding transcriptional LysR family regulator